MSILQLKLTLRLKNQDLGLFHSISSIRPIYKLGPEELGLSVILRLYQQNNNYYLT